MVEAFSLWSWHGEAAMNQALLIMAVVCCIDHWIVFHHYSAPGQTPKDSSWLVKQYPGSSYPLHLTVLIIPREQLVKVSEKSKGFSVLCMGKKPIKSAIWSNYNDWQINAMFCIFLSINLPIWKILWTVLSLYTQLEIRMYLHSTTSSADLELTLWIIYIESAFSKNLNLIYLLVLRK